MEHITKSEQLRIELRKQLSKEAQRQELTTYDVAEEVARKGGSVAQRMCADWLKKGGDHPPPDSGISKLNEISSLGLGVPLREMLERAESINSKTSKKSSCKLAESENLAALEPERLISLVEKNLFEAIDLIVDVKIELGVEPALKLAELERFKDTMMLGLLCDIFGDYDTARAELIRSRLRNSKSA